MWRGSKDLSPLFQQEPGAKLMMVDTKAQQDLVHLVGLVSLLRDWLKSLTESFQDCSAEELW